MFIVNNLINNLIIKKNNTKLIIIFNNFFFYKFFNFITYNILQYIIYNIYTYINYKIFFLGKTFRFLIKNKKINFFFNRSHITIIFFKNFCKIKKIKKNKFIIYFLNYIDIGVFKKYIKKIRLVNIFTKRGIRLSKSFFFKKKGKISTYR